MERFFIHNRKCMVKDMSILFILILALFAFSCEQTPTWDDPVREYFEYYTETAAIGNYDILQPYWVDMDGNICLSSDGDKDLTLYARNPKKYTLLSNWTANDPDGAGDVNIVQDTDDPMVFHLKFSQTFLLNHERGGDIGGTITQTETVSQRVFEKERFSLDMRCNSRPPEIIDGAVMLCGNIYYLCLNIPVTDIHRDLRKIIIDDGNVAHTVEFDVDASCDIQLPSPCIFSSTGPSNLEALPDGATFSPGAKNNLYYNSGITANPNTVQTFKITLMDEAGLSSSTVISSASKQVKVPALSDSVSNAVLSSSGETTLTLNGDFNAQVKITKPTQATNGDPISSAVINYELKKDNAEVSLAPTDSNGDKILTLEDTGTYTLKVWATAEGYLASETKTYSIKVPPLKVRFYANGGSLVSGGVNPQEIPKNVATPLTQASNVVTKTGYEFTGWASSATGTKIYDDGENVTLQSDTNLYALWQAKTYTVSFSLNYTGATGAPTDITVTYDGTYGNRLPTASPTRYGYTFNGWYTAQTGGTQVTSGTMYTTDGNSTLYAHWTAKTCTVTFNANYTGSTYSQARTETFGSNYTLPTAPTRTGYTFKGWYKETGFTTQVTASTAVSNESDHTLYAKWQANTYTVKFNLNYTDAPTAPTDITVTYDGTYSGLTNPTRTGYTFDGWYTAVTGGTKVTTTTKVQITGPQTLYAHWKLNYHAYTCNPTNGSLETITATIPMDSGKIAYGATVKIMFKGNAGYGLSSVEIKETGGIKKLTTSDITLTENGGTQVYVKFTMPDYPVTITPTFRKAYKVKITPYSCTYSGITEYVKEKCKNKTVRIWIADKDGQGIFDDQYKEVTLDENAEYDGYILYPNNVTTLSSNALLCALTVNVVSNIVGNHGFCYRSVNSSGTTNLTMAMLLTDVDVTAPLTAHVYSRQEDDTPYTFSTLPGNIGFVYKWKIYDIDSSNTPTLKQEFTWINVNSYSVPTDNLVSGQRYGLGSVIKVAGISVSSNSLETFQYNP